jgi:hypothetical protein
MSEAEALIERLRSALGQRRGLTEKKMFGGVCFMLRDHMLCGASRRGFMFRVGDAREAAALARAGTRRMEMNSREYPGYVRADPARCKAADVRALIALAVDYVEELPAKTARAAARKPAARKTRKAAATRVRRAR